MTPASMPGTSFPAGRPPTRTLARGDAARSRRTPGRHTGDLHQAKAVFAERSPYGRLRETLGLVPMRMVSVLTALEVRPSNLVTG